MQARGEALRADDNPDVLHRRLVAYREQTAPLIAYYRDKGTLRTVDGMAPIEAVAAQIEKLLSANRAPAAAPVRRRLPRMPKPPKTALQDGATKAGAAKSSPKRARKAAKPAARKSRATRLRRPRRGRRRCAASRRPAAPRPGAKPPRARAPAARSEPDGQAVNRFGR